MPRSVSKTRSVEPEPEVSDIVQSRVEEVQAGLVRMKQSAASQITSDAANLHMSAAAEVRASLVDGRQVGFGLVDANEVWMTNSAAGAVLGENVAADGVSAVVLGRNVSLSNAAAGIVAGQHVRAGQIRTVLLLSGKVDGTVHTYLDTRQTLMAGLIGGLVAGAIFSVARFLSRRR